MPLCSSRTFQDDRLCVSPSACVSLAKSSSALTIKGVVFPESTIKMRPSPICATIPEPSGLSAANRQVHAQSDGSRGEMRALHIKWMSPKNMSGVAAGNLAHCRAAATTDSHAARDPSLEYLREPNPSLTTAILREPMRPCPHASWFGI
jgi:hypothetical protein